MRSIRIYYDRDSENRFPHRVCDRLPWAQCNPARFEPLSIEETGAMDDCDFVICPLYWGEPQDANPEIDKLAAEAKRKNKRVIVFMLADPTRPLNTTADNLIVFRTSLKKSQRQPHEFILPAFPDEDILKHGVPFSPLTRADIPIVGFCGYVDNNAETWNPLKRFVKTYTYQHVLSNVRLERALRTLGIHLTRHEGRRIRTQAIRLLSNSPELRTNFIFRQSFRGGLHREGAAPDARVKESSQKEFCANVLGSHYTLACRGGGNFSFRLYETLALGRIPVFINTDCVMPYEEWVDWKPYCVWVEERKMTRLPQRLLEYHRSLSAEQFAERQSACRQFWEGWLSPRGYFQQFHRYLRPLLDPERL
ncbi:MAG: exostosin family protein [Verrucomicrobia bacterium]|nr:exostosin family protein [Verrucomicrobiota bacterium]